jgi:hypothetical protein
MNVKYDGNMISVSKGLVISVIGTLFLAVGYLYIHFDAKNSLLMNLSNKRFERMENQFNIKLTGKANTELMQAEFRHVNQELKEIKQAIKEVRN